VNSIWRRSPSDRITTSDLIRGADGYAIGAEFFEPPAANENTVHNAISTGSGTVVNPSIGVSPDPTTVAPTSFRSALFYGLSRANYGSDTIYRHLYSRDDLRDLVNPAYDSYDFPMKVPYGAEIGSDGPFGYPCVNLPGTGYEGNEYVMRMWFAYGDSVVTEFYFRSTAASFTLITDDLRAYSLYFTSGQLRFIRPSFTPPAVDLPNLNDGQWHHVAIVGMSNAARIAFAIDGSIVLDDPNYNGSPNLSVGGCLKKSTTIPNFVGSVAMYRQSIGLGLHTTYLAGGFTPPKFYPRRNTASRYLPTFSVSSSGHSSSPPADGDFYWDQVSLLVGVDDTTSSQWATNLKNPYLYASGNSAVGGPYGAPWRYFSSVYVSGLGLDVAVSDFTFEFWLKYGGVTQYILSNTTFTFEFNATGYLQVTLQDSTADVFLSSGFRFDPGDWHHVALCANGTNVALYVDGIRRVTGTRTTTVGPLNTIQLDNQSFAEPRLTAAARYTESTYTVPSAPFPMYLGYSAVESTGAGANTTTQTSLGMGVVTSGGTGAGANTTTQASVGTGAVRVTGAGANTTTQVSAGAGNVGATTGIGANTVIATSLGAGVVRVTGAGANTTTQASVGTGAVRVTGAGANIVAIAVAASGVSQYVSYGAGANTPAQTSVGVGAVAISCTSDTALETFLGTGAGQLRITADSITWTEAYTAGNGSILVAGGGAPAPFLHYSGGAGQILIQAEAQSSIFAFSVSDGTVTDFGTSFDPRRTHTVEADIRTMSLRADPRVVPIAFE